MYTDFFKVDRGGGVGIICVLVGFVNLIFFSNDNIYLFSLMILLALISILLVFNDRNDVDIMRYKIILCSVLIGAISLLVYYYFRIG